MQHNREPGSQVSGDQGPRTVLLVEDNPTDVFVIREAIQGSGLDLTLRVASNGQDALAYLQELATRENPSCPSLVLLDLNLPKVSGIEVLRYLRSESPFSKTPVIIVTSSTAEADRAAVQRLGAEAYFQKSNKLAAYLELTQLIRRFLDTGEEGRD